MSHAMGLSPDHIVQIGMGFWASKTLLSAVEMGVFTELTHGPAELDHLAGRVGLHPRSARDFYGCAGGSEISAATGWGVFEYAGD